MRHFLWVAIACIIIQNHAFAQSSDEGSPVGDGSGTGPDAVASGGAVSVMAIPEFTPMTASERARRYMVGAFGPGAILRSVASGGISQLTNSPKEWGGGAQAYGYRVGNAFAEHVIREALEYGASTALHEDNRYFRSTESGFLKRSTHAAASAFIARNDAGGEHFAYSKVGAVLGSAFISRAWQPASKDTPGDAVVNFGVTMAAEIGWNFFKEFSPRSLSKKLRVR